MARFSDWRYIPLFSYRKVDWRTNAVVMRRLLIPFSFHFQPSELQRTTIGIISFLTIFIRGRPAVFHLHFLSPSVVFSNLFSFYMGGGQTLVPELSYLSLEYILWKLLDFPVKSHMTSNMNLSIRNIHISVAHNCYAG